MLEIWNKDYNKKKPHYEPIQPYVLGRYMYVASTINKYFKKKLNFCDYAASKGIFLKILNNNTEKFKLFGVEADKNNCKKIKKLKFKVINRSLGIHLNYKTKNFKENIQVGSILWTLSCCLNPINVLKDIYKTLDKNGYLVVAESSRIMVPFKKN